MADGRGEKDKRRRKRMIIQRKAICDKYEKVKLDWRKRKGERKERAC